MAFGAMTPIFTCPNSGAAASALNQGWLLLSTYLGFAGTPFCSPFDLKEDFFRSGVGGCGGGVIPKSAATAVGVTREIRLFAALSLSLSLSLSFFSLSPSFFFSLSPSFFFSLSASVLRGGIRRYPVFFSSSKTLSSPSSPSSWAHSHSQ